MNNNDDIFLQDEIEKLGEGESLIGIYNAIIVRINTLTSPPQFAVGLSEGLSQSFIFYSIMSLLTHIKNVNPKMLDLITDCLNNPEDLLKQLRNLEPVLENKLGS